MSIIKYLKDLFNKDADSSSIIYDTGKDLSSLYGKETVKKEIGNRFIIC